MERPLRALLVADMHHAERDAPPKRCTAALGLLEPVLECSALWEPDVLIDLGDRIDDTDRDTDLVRARQVAAKLVRCGVPRHHVMGNHDSYTINVEEWEEILAAPVHSHSVDAAGYHLTFFSPNVNNQRGAFPYSLSDADLSWLEQDLNGTNLPTIVFSHIPFMAGKMANHFYFEGCEGRAEFLNSKLARDIAESAAHTILVCAGHVHWNSVGTSHGVHYATIQSLTETFTTGPKPAGAFAFLEVGETIKIRVVGEDPLTIELPRRKSGYRWLRP